MWLCHRWFPHVGSMALGQSPVVFVLCVFLFFGTSKDKQVFKSAVEFVCCEYNLKLRRAKDEMFWATSNLLFIDIRATINQCLCTRAPTVMCKNTNRLDYFYTCGVDHCGTSAPLRGCSHCSQFYWLQWKCNVVAAGPKSSIFLWWVHPSVFSCSYLENIYSLHWLVW